MPDLKCSKCGSEEFENWCSKTLLLGPTNWYTYQCSKCGHHETVKRTDTNYGKGRKIKIGDQDKVVEAGDFS